MRSITKHISTILLTACAALILHSCSTTRSVPEGDRLYTGTTIKWEGKKPKDYSSLKSGLDKRVRPSPNRRFFGMPFKLWLYNLGKEPKPGKKGLNHLLRKKWGEPPVLLSQAKPDYTANVLEQYLVDNGYFKATVTSAIKNSGTKKAAGIYTATPDQRYYIKSVTFETDSSELGKAVAQTARNSSLIVKKPYSLDSVKAERQRIHLTLKELGYYYFTQDYLLVEVDSTNQGSVDLYVKIKETTPGIARRKYTLKNVTLYPSYSLESDSSSMKGDTVVYKGLNLVDPDKKFKPDVFERSVFLKPDSLYRLSAHNITLQRLVNLGTFKFVRGQFRPVRDSNKLNANFFLTPYPRRSLQAELRGTSKSNNFVGSEIRVTARNRNWLHAANLLELSLSGGMEWQTGGGKQQASTNSYSLKGELSVTMPRFFIPFFQNVNLRTPYVPRTRISGSYELFSRANLYNLNAYTVQLQYLWKKSAFLEHNLAPIAITYVLPTKTTAAYDSILLVDPAQRNAISKQFILGSNYTITFNNQSAERIHGFYLSGNVDVSGNLAGLIVPKKGDTTRQIFGNPFAQFVRFGAEGRHYWKLSKGMTWVNRLFAGYGIPYGNSKSLPFIKQYFTGGSSSIRAFRARTLGPGSYHNDTTNLFLANEAGDVKLEFNSELRMHIASVVNAAIFVDAGNIWLRKEADNKPGSEFNAGRFTSEIAVGAGAGLRIDASIVVVRFDLAFPLRKPWLPEKERWVFKDIRFGDPEWRKENLVLNIAIGYPF